jgi:stage IV sporulation protein FB
MLAVPDHTPYDLRFRLGPYPVRIHPLFWLMAAVVGWSTRFWGNAALLLWVGCVLVSVLVHELGHAVAARATGRRPAIVLWLMGGLCVYDTAYERPWQRFWVLVWGPGAGFVLAALAYAVGHAAYGMTAGDQLFLLFGWSFGRPGPGLLQLFFGHPSPRLLIVHFLIEINVLWGLLNLLPIYPLDGGQITGVLTTMLNPRKGMRWTHIISAVTAGALAVWALTRENYFRFFFMGSFAGYNVRLLLDLRERGYVGYDDRDEADWWKH